MKDIFFWHNWQKSYKYFYIICFLVFLAALSAYFYAFLFGQDRFVGWQTNGEIENLSIIPDRFPMGFFEFASEVDTFLFYDFFGVGKLTIEVLFSELYLIAIYFGLILLLAASAYMSRLWFILTNIVLILHLSFTSFSVMSAELGRLDAGDPYNWFFMLCLVLFFPFNFYLHTYKSNLSFPARVLIFSIFGGGLAYLFANHYAHVEFKSLFVVNYGFLVPLGLTFLFTLFNANEIVHSIFHLTARGGQKSVRPFAILSVLYLANLVYSFFKSIHIIDFDILHISPFVVFAITAVLGIWGFRRREQQYESAISFAPYGSIFYLAMGIIALSSMAYAQVMDNTPLIEVYEDLILFSHIGFGVGMVIYTLANFYTEFPSGEDLTKKLWTPNVFSYLATASFAMFIFAIFLLRYDFYMYRQMHAGYNNGLADCYLAEGQEAVAVDYYQKAMLFEFANQRSNYALACIAEERNNMKEVKEYLENTFEKNSSPHIYIYAATIYLRNQDKPRAIEILKDGIEKHPFNGELHNNLALLYVQIGQAEKALETFIKARENINWKQKEIIDANMYGIWAKFDLKQDMNLYLDAPKGVKALANFITVKNILNEEVPFSIDENLLKDSLLNTEQLCYLYNITFNKLRSSDDKINKALDKALAFRGNEGNHSFLLFAKANKLFYSGNVDEAVLIMRQMLESGTNSNPNYSNQLALWLLEHKQYDEAAKQFQDAMLNYKKDAALNRAICLSELPDKARAINFWRAFDTLPNHPYRPIAADLLSVMVFDSLKNFDAKKSNDQKRYQYLHYQNQFLTHNLYFDVVKTIEDFNLLGNAVLDRIDFCLENNQLDSALSYRSALTGMFNLSNTTLDRMKITDLRLLSESKQYDKMGILLKELETNRQTAAPKKLYEAIYNAALKLDAEKLFTQAQHALPFEEKVYTEAVLYFNDKKEKEKAYNFLLEGLKIIPESIEVNKLYVRQCLEMGYANYAERSYRELRTLLSPEAREVFAKEYEAKLIEMQKRDASW